MRPPARDGGAGRRPRSLADADAQQEQRDAGSFRRSRQTQGRGEIERARAAGNFDHGGAKAPASRGVDGRAQDGLGVPAKHQGKDSGIDAEFRQSHAIQPSRLGFEKILPRPEHRPSSRRAQGKCKSKTGGGRPIGAARRQHFMQAGAAQAAAEKSVDIRRAQREKTGALHRRGLNAAVAPPFDSGERQTQSGQGLCARRRIAPPRNFRHGSALMFMLCSKQKPKGLLSQAESSDVPAIARKRWRFRRGSIQFAMNWTKRSKMSLIVRVRRSRPIRRPSTSSRRWRSGLA